MSAVPLGVADARAVWMAMAREGRMDEGMWACTMEEAMELN